MSTRSDRVIMVIVAVVAIGAVVLLVGILRSGDDNSSRYRLRAETMLPVAGPIDVRSIECPDSIAPSPVEYSPTGALADELAVYEGELIAVRILVSPEGDSLPSTIRFEASWPSSVIDGGVECAFLVGEASRSQSTMTWEPGESSASFRIDDPEPVGTTTLEVWFAAADPDPGTAFSTSLVPIGGQDLAVIDRLGGRVVIDERPGVPGGLSVQALRSVSDDGTFEVAAQVSNPSATGRILGATLVFDSDVGVAWVLDSDGATGRECGGSRPSECLLGDVGAGETIVVRATGRVPDGWTAAPTRCPTDQASTGIGLCVTARLESDGVDRSEVPARRVLVEADVPASGPLDLAPESEPVIVRANQESDVFLVLRTSRPTIISFQVVGSDCGQIERVEGQGDDGDSFLTAGESWRFVCRVVLDQPSNIRVDVSAVDGGGVTYSSSVSIPAIVIDPELAVTVSPDDETGAATVLVSNSGSGDLTDLATVIPGCETVTLISGSPTTLLEGDTVGYRCSSGAVEVESIRAYATDASGSVVSTGTS